MNLIWNGSCLGLGNSCLVCVSRSEFIVMPLETAFLGFG